MKDSRGNAVTELSAGVRDADTLEEV